MIVLYKGATDKGIVRENNEDSFYAGKISDNTYVFIVADGMGGHKAGEVASKKAIEFFLQRIKKLEEFDEQILSEIISDINEKIVKIGKDDLKKEGLGTTFSALIIKGDKGFIVHVGDSRVYVLDKKLYQLTEDHSIVEKLLRGGLISKKEAENHPRKNVLYQSLGMKGEIKPETKEIKVETGKTFLLCSDGLFNVVSDEKIEWVLKTASHELAVDELIRLAKEGGGPDNITVIVVKIKDETDDEETKEIKLNLKKKRKFLFGMFTFLIFALGLSVFFFYSKAPEKIGKKEDTVKTKVEKVKKDNPFFFKIKKLDYQLKKPFYFTNGGYVYLNRMRKKVFFSLISGEEIELNSVSYSSEPVFGDDFFFWNSKDKRIYRWKDGVFSPLRNILIEEKNDICGIFKNKVFKLKASTLEVTDVYGKKVFSHDRVKGVYLSFGDTFSIFTEDGEVIVFEYSFKELKRFSDVKILKEKKPLFIIKFSNSSVIAFFEESFLNLLQPQKENNYVLNGVYYIRIKRAINLFKKEVFLLNDDGEIYKFTFGAN